MTMRWIGSGSRVVCGLIALGFWGCSDESGAVDGAGDGGSGGQSAPMGPVAGGSGTGGSGGGGAGGSGGSGGGGAGGSGGSGGSGASASVCPRVELSGELPIVYQGDTTGLPNLAWSTRLEWEEAPDDSLLFTVPVTGDYRIEVIEDPSTNDGCGASIHEADGTLYTPDWCPDAGEVVELDGYYAGIPLVRLTEGQQILIWVSCSPWASVQEGPYTLIVELGPE